MTMRERYDYYQSEMDRIDKEIKKVQSMTEEEMQEAYRTDETMIEKLAFLFEEYDCAESCRNENEDYDDYSDPSLDPAFASEEDYLQYRFG